MLRLRRRAPGTAKIDRRSRVPHRADIRERCNDQETAAAERQRPRRRPAADARAREDRRAKRTTSSQRWLERQLNDPYVAASKRDGMRSRAAYKLSEIDEKYRLLKPGSASSISARRRAAGARSRPSACNRDGSGQGRQVVAIDYLGHGGASGRRDRSSSISPPRVPNRGSRRCCATAAPTSCCPTWRRHTVGHTRTDHLRIMGLAEAAAGLRLRRAGAGRRFSVQGAPGRHRARSARSAEAALRDRAARQAAGQPRRFGRALRAGDRLPRQTRRSG